MLNLCGKIGAWTMVLVLLVMLVGCGNDKARAEKGGGEISCRDHLYGRNVYKMVIFDEYFPSELSKFLSPMMALSIENDCDGERAVLIRSVVGRDTLDKIFVLRDSAAMAENKPLPPDIADAKVLRYPLERVVVLSSAQIGYMTRLGLEDRIVGVGEGKYIADSTLYAKVAAKEIVEIGYGNAADYEKLMALKPDLVMTFATGGGQDDYERMEKLGLPVMLTPEWRSSSPVTKARWLELYGVMFGVEELAKAELLKSELAYGTVYASADSGSSKPCPRVLAGMSYGGVWYAPGGNSYTGNLIKDAGGCYLWASDTTRELKLTIEDVMALADSVDIWINPGMFGSPEEILAAEPRAAHIKAFKNKKVFQNDGRKGPGGGNDFFESAVARPAELLWNLKKQFGTAPEVLPKTTLGKPIRPISVDTSFEWYHNIF